MAISTTYTSKLRQKLWYFIAIFIWEILRWLLKGIAEEAIFGNIYQWIAERGGALKSILDYFQSNPWYLWLILPIGILVLLVWAYVDTKRKESSQVDTKHENPIGVLTAMHDRMMYLKEKRLKQKFDRKRFEEACPLFFDQLGVVKLGEWETYERRIAKRIKRHVPKSPERKARVMWRYKVIGEAKQIVKELVNSKVWQIDDLVKAGGHLDSMDMGLGELRDADEQWQNLFKMVKPYTTDSILGGLVDNYLSHSYAFCSALLVRDYGNRLPKHDFGRMLCSALSSSNISPDKIEIALGEILENITKRLKILGERHPLYLSIAVKPSTGKREADYERTEHTMWAELQVTNFGVNEIKDTQVNITKCLTLQVKQDSVNGNDFAMWNQLGIKPFCVYWSERQAKPKQMNLVIPSGATRSALVAFQDNKNGGQFNFNSLNHEWIVGEVKIDVEISSHEAVLWNGDFYIECRPNYLGGERAKFVFVEWNTWIKDKNITQLDFSR